MEKQRAEDIHAMALGEPRLASVASKTAKGELLLEEVLRREERHLALGTPGRAF